jgi:hypothetical protein
MFILLYAIRLFSVVNERKLRFVVHSHVIFPLFTFVLFSILLGPRQAMIWECSEYHGKDNFLS